MAYINADSCENCTHREVCKNKEAFGSIVSQLSSVCVKFEGKNTELLDVDFINSVTIECEHFLKKGCVRL